MEDEYDFVVAGGGPAGLQFAREVAERSAYSVAVLERNDALTDNDKSTGGTFEQVVDGFDIPDDVIMDENDDVVFEGPTAHARLPIPGYVLDFPAFLDYLGADARRHGVDIFTDTQVVGTIDDNGHVTGVRYRRDTAGEVAARITVDATGPAAVLAGEHGLFDRTDAQRGIGKEYEVTGEFDLDSMVFSFDHADAPGGYAWTFPAGDGVFKAGVCWIDDFYAKYGSEGRTIDDFVREWIESDPRWRMDELRATHAGEAVSNNSINQRAADGLLAVGDAVSSINPLFGEGIRPGMESARMAADVAIRALDDGETSREALAAYERRWNRTKGPHWKRQRAVGELLYDFDADQQDAFVRASDDLSAEQIDRLQRYELTLSDLLGLYPFKLRDVTKIPRLLRHL